MQEKIIDKEGKFQGFKATTFKTQKGWLRSEVELDANQILDVSVSPDSIFVYVKIWGKKDFDNNREVMKAKYEANRTNQKT